MYFSQYYTTYVHLKAESTLPDKIITTDTVDEALDKYYRANLLENIYTWTVIWIYLISIFKKGQ